MDATTIQIVAVIGFLWNFHRDISSLCKEVGNDANNLREEVGRNNADLRERMARMEGLLEGLIARPQEAKS